MKLALATAIPLAFFLLLEVVLRLFGFGYPTTFFVEAGKDTLTTNPKFAWQFYSRDTATSPTPLRVLKNKPAGTRRLVVIGESAAAGTPDPAYSFSRILELMLADAPEGRVEVINTAMRGIDSHIARQIASESAQLSPDAFLIYMGNNELIGLHSPDPAKAAFLNHPTFIAIQSTVKATKSAQLVGKALEAVFPPKGKAAQDMDYMRRQAVAFDDPRRDRVYDNYRRNLEAICGIASKAGAKAIVCTVAVNLRDFPPLESKHRRHLAAGDLEKWEKLHASGSQAEYSRQPEQALTAFQAAAAVDDHHAELLYRMARCEEILGRFAEAKTHYALARDRDALQFRSDSRINGIVRDVAALGGTNHVRFADMERALAESEMAQNGILGEPLFQEHVHFYFEGDYEMAKALLPHARAALGLASKSEGTTLTREQCSTRLAYTPVEAANVLAAVAQLTSKPPFLDRLEHQARLAATQHRAREALNRLTTELANESRMAYAKALKDRPDDWMLHYNYARLLTDMGNHADALPEYERIVQMFPHQRTFRHMYGVALYNARQANDAAKEFHAALKLDPHFEPARQALGKLGVK